MPALVVLLMERLGVEVNVGAGIGVGVGVGVGIGVSVGVGVGVEFAGITVNVSLEEILPVLLLPGVFTAALLVISDNVEPLGVPVSVIGGSVVPPTVGEELV